MAAVWATSLALGTEIICPELPRAKGELAWWAQLTPIQALPGEQWAIQVHSGLAYGSHKARQLLLSVPSRLWPQLKQEVGWV